MGNNRFINYKNQPLFYRIYGSGPAVVFIHGFGEDGNIWDYLADKLKDDFLVIIPDLPGSGKSAILKKDEQVSIDDYAAAIVHIITTENVQKCTVIGHSMGGYITLALAANYAPFLNGFGLLNSTAFADNEDKKRSRLKTIEFIQDKGTGLFLKTSIPALFGSKFQEEHAEKIEKLINDMSYFKGEALVQYSKAMINRPERIHVLESTTLPVLLIISENDPAIPLDKSLAQCHLAAIVYVHILAAAGHMGMLEEKDLCAEFILAYLRCL